MLEFMYMEIRQAAIFFNPERESCAAAGALFAKAAEKAGIKHYFPKYNLSLSDILPDTDIIFSVGGDGTILKTARAAAEKGIKILGINAGHLGFLASAEAGLNFETLLEEIKNDNFISQRRMMIGAKVLRKGEEVFFSPALNEAVIKAVSPRSITLRAEYSSRAIKEYTADGILLSTPTGSTAYNLAAGGPIVEPGLDVFILTPICPHTLNQRPLVLPGSGETRIKVISGKSQSASVLSLDGQVNFPLDCGDEIILSKYGNGVNILFPKDYDFLNILSIKLKWGGR